MKSIFELLGLTRLVGVRGAGGCEVGVVGDKWFEGLEPRVLLSVVFGEAAVVGEGVEGAMGAVAGDVDGDGDLDVISTSFDLAGVYWHENDGMGRFAAAREVGVLPGASSRAGVSALGDLDGDGDLDVVVVDLGINRLWRFMNDGTGGFGDARAVTGFLDTALTLSLSDMDGDDDLDVVAPWGVGEMVSWFENNGLGGFVAEHSIPTLEIQNYAAFVEDLDGDGDLDVVSASEHENRVAWHENEGGGVFGERQVITSLVQRPRSVIAADLDGDGDPDVLSASEFDDKVAWYENGGEGGFAGFGSQRLIGPLVDRVRVVVADDLDGDGDLDVLSSSESSGSIFWHENEGGGEFVAHREIVTGASGVRSFVTADLDGDGDVDVLSASRSDGVVLWHENLGHAPSEVGLSGVGVEEGSDAGVVVGVLSAEDLDVGDEHTFELLDDAGGRFRLDGTDLVVVDGDRIDFESSDRHEIRVRVADRLGLRFDQSMFVMVIDVNESPKIEDQFFRLDGAAELGAVIGVVAAGDPDVGDELTYQIVSGNEAGVFDIDSGMGELVVGDDGPLRAGGLTYELMVEVTDVEGLTAMAQVHVSERLPIDAGEGWDDGGADEFRIRRVGDSVQVTHGDEELVSSVFEDTPILRVVGSGDDDRLVIDFSGGAPIPVGGIEFEGGDGDGFDTLVVQGAGVGLVTHRFDSASSGVVDVDGMLVRYTGLEPIEDDLRAVDRIFVFGAGSDEVLLGDDDTVENGVSRISSAGSSEVVDFTTPTGTVTVMAGSGDDTVVLAGLDVVDVDVDVDVVLEGEGGDDVLDTSGVGFGVRVVGGEGDDWVVGGDGDDFVVWEDGDGNDVVDGGGGSDVLLVSGSAEVGDRLIVRERKGRVEVKRKNKRMRFVLDVGGVEGMEIDGGIGDDRIRLRRGLAGAGLSLVTVRGGAGDDRLVGRGADVELVLDGGAGDDRLVGGVMGDVLNGGDGDDRVKGGAGDDLVVGGAGADRLVGQAGVDTVSYVGSPGGVSVSLLRHEAGEDGFGFEDRGIRGFENVVGTMFNDLLEGDRGANVLDGVGGEDVLVGRGGGDTFYRGELMGISGDLVEVEL